MKLHIDTSDNKKTVVGLGDKQITKTHSIPRSQILLKLIDQILRKEKKTLKDVTEISVNPGPGSFTGLRVGISVANALAFALRVKVNGQAQLTKVNYDGMMATK